MYKEFIGNLHILKQPNTILITIGISIIVPFFAVVPLIQTFLLIKDLDAYLDKNIFKVNGDLITVTNKKNNLQTELNKLVKKHQLSTDTVELSREVKSLESKISKLKAIYIEEDEKVLYQSFGIYKPYYDFEKSDIYKEKLKEITAKQKALVKDDSAFNYTSEYTINGSPKKGKKMQQSFAKFGMTTFNLECTTAIKNVKFNNFEQMETKIERSFTKVNKGLESFSIEIRKENLALKMEELHLSFEYAKIKQQEREEEQEVRRLQREEEAELKRIQKEVDAERRKLEKERYHFEQAILEKQKQLKMSKTEEDIKALEVELLGLQVQINNVDEQNEHLDDKLEVKNKAGYVYIISNLGAYGEDVYKIGVTRRANPDDRVKELSGASVPFKFDTHALIFSEDAFALENALHNEFANKKINLANNRKEFFNVTLDEIKQVVRENYNKVVEFVDIPEAEEYRQSLLMLEEAKKVS